MPAEQTYRDGLDLWQLLGLSPLEAVAVVLSTIGMYLAMVVLVRLLGQRMLSGMSGFDLAAMIAFGSVIGRSALGQFPSLGAGLIALASLIAMQGLIGVIRQTRAGHTMVDTHPVLLMAGEKVLEDHMHRCHVLVGELQSRLRLAGVRNYAEVAAVVFEPSGSISVLRRGDPVDPLLLSGVIGASQMPVELLSSSLPPQRVRARFGSLWRRPPPPPPRKRSDPGEDPGSERRRIER